jgi:hypothetical protein
VEDRQGKLVHHLVLGALALLAIPALPSTALPQDGTASGSLTVNGEAVPLRYVYASVQPGFFDKSTEDLRIVLSSVPIPEESRGRLFDLTRMARESGLRAVEVVIDASGDPISGALFLAAFDGMASVSGMHRFEPQVVERSRVAGRLFTERPHSFAGVTWQYDATFSAAIPRPPTPEELAAALASPPAQAATRYLAAIRANGQAPTDIPPDSQVVGLARPTATSAVATVQGHRESDGVVIEFTVRLALEEGDWKVVP